MVYIGFLVIFVKYIGNFWFFCTPRIVDERVVICVIDYNDRFQIKNGYR